MAAPYPVANLQAPNAVVFVDPTSGNVLSGTGGVPVIISGTSTSTSTVVVGGTATTANALSYSQAAGYTQITTAGTTTVKGSSGVFFGAYDPVLGTGTTSTAFSVFDGTVPIQGTATLTALNQLVSAIPSGVGLKFATSLVVVTTGTTVTLNVLWD